MITYEEEHENQYLYNHIRMKIFNLLHIFAICMSEKPVINNIIIIFGNKLSATTKIEVYSQPIIKLTTIKSGCMQHLKHKAKNAIL